MALVQSTENAPLVGRGNILQRWDLARLLTLQLRPYRPFRPLCILSPLQRLHPQYQASHHRERALASANQGSNI